VSRHASRQLHDELLQHQQQRRMQSGRGGLLYVSKRDALRRLQDVYAATAAAAAAAARGGLPSVSSVLQGCVLAPLVKFCSTSSSVVGRVHMLLLAAGCSCGIGSMLLM
jgi:hypothetical protein